MRALSSIKAWQVPFFAFCTLLFRAHYMEPLFLFTIIKPVDGKRSKPADFCNVEES